ncbi:hypothetical protein AAZX31_01G057800 [Glycine max]
MIKRGMEIMLKKLPHSSHLLSNEGNQGQDNNGNRQQRSNQVASPKINFYSINWKIVS